MLEKNKILRALITGYSAEGFGVTRLDGQVVFVPGAIEGEVCDVRIVKVLKNIAYGRVERLLSPSAHRLDSDCPHDSRCGGCSFRHMDYAEELRSKLQRGRDALQRLGGSDIEPEGILGATETTHYRNKALFPIGPQGQVGFYRARSHEVQDVPACLLQKPEANEAARALREYMKLPGVTCYDETRHKGLLRHLFVRTNQAGESLVCLVANGDKLPHEDALVDLMCKYVPACVGLVLSTNTRRTNVALGDSYRTLWGEDTVEDTLCGLTFRLSVPSFYQVNRDQAERLYEKAVEYADLHGTETVLDLYCGAGTITQVMAKRAGKVIGAEIVPEAIADAREAAKRNGIENVDFFCGDASDVAAKFAAEGLTPDVISVDPPRKGLSQVVVDAVASMQPGRIVYVSCDPATLGRDVKRFAAHGYRVVKATAVDMFPRTAHVETVALLTKVK